MSTARLSVMAIAAHPDDIEFGMAGTLCLLRDLGAELHYCNVADGCCGSNELSGDEISSLRLQEAKAAAALLDALFYPPLAHDLEIFYNPELLARLAGYIRRARPDILLVPSLEDYMDTMKELSAEVGAMAGLSYGEGWRRHNPLGFDPSGADPLAECLPHRRPYSH